MSKKGAAAQKKPERLLRVGVIQGGKIVEERLFDSGESATIGRGGKNTFVVEDAQFPPQHRIFVSKGKRYFLAAPGPMTGKISLGSQVVDLADLKKKGKAVQRGDVWVFPLDPRMRGKVQTANTTILFQFVPPPPKALRQGAARFHGIDWTEVDWLYITCMMFSAIMGLAFTLWTSSMPVEEVTLEDLPDRFVTVVVEEAPAPEPEELPAEEGEGPATAEKAEKAKTEAPKKSAAEKAESEAARRDRMREKVNQKGLLAMLGARSVDGSSSGAVADLMGDTGALAANLDDALEGISGVKVAQIGDKAGVREGSGGDELAGVGDLGGTGSSGSSEIKKQTIKVASIDSGAVEVTSGNADMDKVGAVLRKNVGRAKSCYEKELKNNPNLQGKVVIKIKIGSGGKVASASVKQNTTGSQAVGSCIVSRIRRVTFPEGASGAEVVWPLNLFPS